MTFPLIACALACPVPPPFSPPELTVYNQGFALVKQMRFFDLTAGVQKISIEDVSAMIDSTSVGFKCVGVDRPFTVREQNYQYDLISIRAILDKSVGRRIRFVRTVGSTKEVLQGVLISSPTAIVSVIGSGERQFNGMVVHADDGRIVLDPTGEVEVDELPTGLISRPTLTWTIDAPSAATYPVALSYVSNGFSWNADYVLTLDGRGQGDLQGWVTVDNQCGTRFANAKLKLLAGEVNVIRAARRQPAGLDLQDQGMLFGLMREESLFEYHLYTLNRLTTLENRETKQIALLAGSGLNARTRLHVAFDAEEADSGDRKPDSIVEFTNSVANHLGMPLPKGRFRVYQRDASGSVQLLGENQIDHTPRDETISLVVGKSFDVVARSTCTQRNVLGPHHRTSMHRVEVRNRKATAQAVEVDAHLSGSWKLTQATLPSTKIDASTLRFFVTVPAGQTKSFTYAIDHHD